MTIPVLKHDSDFSKSPKRTNLNIVWTTLTVTSIENQIRTQMIDMHSAVQ